MAVRRIVNKRFFLERKLDRLGEFEYRLLERSGDSTDDP